MAQNITIAGASYSAVPSIQVPKTGSGTATFVDTSDANAGASDIMSGKTAYVNGAKVTGTATQSQTYAEEPNSAGGNTAIITGGLSAYPLPTADYNKVDFGNNTLIDLSSDTVTPADVASGKTFHDSDGVQQTGTLGYATATGASLSISFDVKFEPAMFYVIRGGWSGREALTPTTTHQILDIGMIDNHIYAQNYYRDSSYYIYINRYTESDISWTYSNNTLTITSASTTVGRFGTSSYELFYF